MSEKVCAKAFRGCPTNPCCLFCNKNETPRTDAKERETLRDSEVDLRASRQHAYYGWKFARQIERELTETQARLRALLEGLEANNIDEAVMTDPKVLRAMGERIAAVAKVGSRQLERDLAFITKHDER